MKTIKVISLVFICVYILFMFYGFYLETNVEEFKYTLMGNYLLIDKNTKKQINKFYWCDNFSNTYYKTYLDKYNKRNGYIRKQDYLKNVNISVPLELKIKKIGSSEYRYYDNNNRLILKTNKNNIIEKADKFLIEYEGTNRNLLNINGNVILSNLNQITFIGENNFLIEEQEKKYIFNAETKKILFEAKIFGMLNENKICFSKDGKNYGYIDINGNIVIPAIYTYASDFSEDITLVKKGNVNMINNMGYINSKNEMIIPFKYYGGDYCVNNTVLVGKISINNLVYKSIEVMCFKIYLFFKH